jgi:hypothetical protein
MAQQGDASAAPLLKALGAFDGGGLSGSVGSKEGSDLAVFGNKGDAPDHPEHFAIQAGQRTNILY